MAFTIRWLGQGGFLMRLGDRAAAFDPYLSDSVAASGDRFHRLVPIPIAPEELAVGLIAFSHDHLDHLDPDTVVKTDAPAYAGPASCLKHLAALGIPAEKRLPLGRGDVYRLGGARLMGVPAAHTDDSVGWVIEYAGVRLYITADTLYDDSLADAGALGIDIFLCCVNGRLGNMNAQEAARVARDLPCRLAIPMHYGMFAENTCDPADFARAMEGSGIPVCELPFNAEVEVLDLLKKAV
ncbi:MAG: MBL fold metallo-hydrolase [Clostridiales bacterium]|nr:MBL fold metallo-hydrolase [Clostridiales bacterium]